MITLQEVVNIDKRIREAIENTLDALRVASLPNYVLFLADGEHIKELEPIMNMNPFGIDYRMDRLRDHDRFEFLVQFIQTFYSGANGQTSIDDNTQRIHMELMIYTHIWESKPFLKRLYRLAHISNGEEYLWIVSIPDTGKHKFILKTIRETFYNTNNDLGDIIKRGFHTSLRNAFAHSEYFFNNLNNEREIALDNSGGQAWELDCITYDDWSKRFVYSALLSYHLLSVTFDKRKSLIADTGTDTFTIKQPTRAGGLRDVNIVYGEEDDTFRFQQ
ncbi:MAG TPA: hypothetical protein DCR35_08955 [Runella sp.]|nr:hypothetical protein [Runella sp.]HAO49406.1 hypothetical protein [Runella sp.]